MKKSLPGFFNWFDFSVFFKYASVDLIYHVATMLCELYILRIINVELIGVWQFALLLQSYVIISRLGIINAFNRAYPYYNSSENIEKVRSILETTSFHVRISMIFQSVFFGLAALYFLFSGKDVMLVVAMCAMILFTILDAGANFEEAKLRGVLRFSSIAQAKMLVVVISITSLVLPITFGFAGLISRVLLVQACMFAFLKSRATMVVTPKFSKKEWIELFRDGWKLWVWSYSKTFIKSLPKLFLSFFASLAVFGLFTPINWVLLTFSLFTSSLSTYLYPVLSHYFAVGMKDLPIKTLTINFIAFIVALPFASIGIFALPYLVSKFIPEYYSVVRPMQITMLASAFDIIVISSTIWVSMQDWKRMFLSINLIFVFSLLSYVWLYNNQSNLLYNLSLCILFNSVLSAIIITIMLIHQHVETKKKNSVLHI